MSKIMMKEERSCFPTIDILFSLQIAQKVERKSPHLKARTLAPTLNGPRKGVNQKI
jgi:hypothetical protein